MYALAKKDLFREKIRKRVKKVRTTCLVHAKVYTIHTQQRDSILFVFSPYLVHPCDKSSNGGCNQICKKMKNEYACACQDGFVIGSDGKTCIKGQEYFSSYSTLILVLIIYHSEYFLV